MLLAVDRKLKEYGSKQLQFQAGSLPAVLSHGTTLSRCNQVRKLILSSSCSVKGKHVCSSRLAAPETRDVGNPALDWLSTSYVESNIS